MPDYYPPGAVSATDTSGANLSLLTPVQTGGTSTAYTLTDSRIGSPVDGQVFAFRVHTNCGADPTLAVNGTTARYIMQPDPTMTSFIAMRTAQLIPQGAYLVRYVAGSGIYMLLSRVPLTTSDIPGGLIAGKILATVDTSGTGSITGGGYTTLRFTTATNTISTAGSGYYTLTKAGMLTYELRLIVDSSRDMEIRPGLNGSSDFVVRKTDTEFVITGLMPVAIGEYIEFSIYNYGSSVSPSSGRLRAALLAI